MELDTCTIDRNPETEESSPQPQLMKKKVKLKRADHELRKCIGNGGKLRETVLKSYSCAWQKDILVHGRLHLTQNWLCFYSNILGWETKASVYLKDITAITKQKTALVFPNAILVEVGDKKYGFTSFVHRDRSYKVLHLIWQNSHLQQPSSSEALKAQLGHLSHGKQQSQSLASNESKSLHGDSSDVETGSIVSSTSPTHSPSHSQPSTPYASHSHLPAPQACHRSYSQPSTPQTASLHLLHSPAELDHTNTNSHPPLMFSQDQVDEGLSDSEMIRLCHPSSTCTSDSASERDSVTNSPLFERHPSSEEESQCSSTNSSPPSSAKPQSLTRSPSLITLKPSRSDLDTTPPAAAPVALFGGSPNFLHHWKQTLSVATVWQALTTTIAKPQHLAGLCTPSRLINMLIILFIVLLLLSTASMLCQLSRVEPALQPYLGWQPWCSCFPVRASLLDDTISTT